MSHTSPTVPRNPSRPTTTTQAKADRPLPSFETVTASLRTSIVRPCSCRPVVIPLQAGGELGLQPDGHGYVVATMVDAYGNANQVLLNDEELGLLRDETGGVR